MLWSLHKGNCINPVDQWENQWEIWSMSRSVLKYGEKQQVDLAASRHCCHWRLGQPRTRSSPPTPALHSEVSQDLLGLSSLICLWLLLKPPCIFLTNSGVIQIWQLRVSVANSFFWTMESHRGAAFFVVLGTKVGFRVFEYSPKASLVAYTLFNCS